MFACIFIPDFIVESVLRAEPILRGQAVAVLEGKPPLCYVVGANDAARHLGVEIGMTKLLAETLQQENKNGRPIISTSKTEHQETNNEELPPDAEREKVMRRRPHSAGAYEATYGRMDSRFGLYRTRLEADELQANDPTGSKEPQKDFSPKHVASRRGEKIQRNGTPWSHEAIRQGSFVPPGKDWFEPRFKRAPSLMLRQRSSAQEDSAHAALLDAGHAVSPKVEDSAPDTIILDVAGLERLFGTPQQIAQELLRRVTEVGLVGNVALAANPDATEHAARGFPGITILTSNREAERLSTLPLEILFAAERSAVMRSTKRRDQQRKATDHFQRMQETLDRWGIRNFRGLATLPPVSLSERLGARGVHLQKLASGGAHRELVLAEPALHFEETIELEYPVDVLEPLAFLIGRMLDGLCGRLSARSLSTNELRLRMKLEHRTSDEAAKSKQELEGEPIVERKLALPVPMNDARLFLKLLQLELSAMPPGAPVTQLWLQAEPARPRMGQAGLFQPLAPEAQKLELTLARMHKLLAVRDQLRTGSVELLDTHQPDSFRMQRFLPAADEERFRKKTSQVSESTIEASSKLEGKHNTGYLSLRRFRPPLSATVGLRNSIPVRLGCPDVGALDPTHDNIIWSAGPWRTSGNWWEDSSPRPESDPPSNTNPQQSTAQHWNNEEWDIALSLTLRGSSPGDRTTQIGLYRLVHSLITGDWTIEAGYD